MGRGQKAKSVKVEEEEEGDEWTQQRAVCTVCSRYTMGQGKE
jgi:hypothetical protein